MGRVELLVAPVAFDGVSKLKVANTLILVLLLIASKQLIVEKFGVSDRGWNPVLGLLEASLASIPVITGLDEGLGVGLHVKFHVCVVTSFLGQVPCRRHSTYTFLDSLFVVHVDLMVLARVIALGVNHISHILVNILSCLQDCVDQLELGGICAVDRHAC